MGSPWKRKAAVLSPNGDSRGANIHSALREHRDLSGCGSVPADIRSLEPVPQYSCSKPVSCSFLGMSSRKAPLPHAAIFPQEGTLQEDHPFAVSVSSGSNLDHPPQLHMPWVLDLTSSYAASWFQLPSVSYASSNTGPRQPSLYNQLCPPHLCDSSTLSHLKGAACWPETQRQPPVFTCSGGWPTFIQQLDLVLRNLQNPSLNLQIPAWQRWAAPEVEC